MNFSERVRFFGRVLLTFTKTVLVSSASGCVFASVFGLYEKSISKRAASSVQKLTSKSRAPLLNSTANEDRNAGLDVNGLFVVGLGVSRGCSQDRLCCICTFLAVDGSD